MNQPLTHQERPLKLGLPSLSVSFPWDLGIDPQWFFRAFVPLHPGFPSCCWQFDVTFTDCHSWKRKPSADTTPYCYAPIRITESNEHSEQFGSWHVVKKLSKYELLFFSQ